MKRLFLRAVPSLGRATLFLSLAFPVFSASAFAVTLSEARQEYSTRLTRISKAPQQYSALTLPAGVKEITYESGRLKLKAWVSMSTASQQAAPAVVFLHGGFAFDPVDWEAAKAFIDAGYILMMPRLRAENGNPGNFELFGGEVDDAIAAGRFLAAQPGVDKDRVFLIGHSVGASLAILVAQTESPFKASASLSGYPRLLDWIDHFERIVPFDLRDEKERKIRNPYLYADSVRRPLYLFSESDNPHVKAANAEFCAMVARTSHCKHEVVSGDHGTMIKPAVTRVISLFGAAGKTSR